jgi:cytochrome c peroxidase
VNRAANIVAFLTLSIAIAGCGIAGHEARDPAVLDVPAGFEPMPIPSHNPLTVEKVALGERLFFDPDLSEDRSLSCASCHFENAAFADPRRLSPGVHGRLGIRNSPTLVNVGYINLLFWDGGALTLEAQALGPIEADFEMNMNLGDLVRRIGSDESYVQQFEEAFGEGPSVPTLTQALASFQRTIRSGGSRFDRFQTGESSALSAAEQRGLELFNGKANCASCHNGFLFTNQAFENNGIEPAGSDSGRARITLDPEDYLAFRVPSLRNVEKTAPYMHDGRFASLDEVVAHYNRGGTGVRNQSSLIEPLHLTEGEKDDLISFLKTLTDDVILTGLNPQTTL